MSGILTEMEERLAASLGGWQNEKHELIPSFVELQKG